MKIPASRAAAASVRAVVTQLALILGATAAHAADVIVSASAISTTQVSVSASVGFSGSCPRIVRWTSGTGQVPIFTTCTGNEFPTSIGTTDSGLSPNTTYFYCGFDGALDEVGNYTPYSGCNNTVSVVTFGPPSAPSSLSATGSGTQINLTWADGSGNETGFLIERKTGSGGTFSQIASVGTNVTSYSNTGLTADTSYFYRVRSTNAYGSSGYTNTASANTAPQAPTGLGATIASPTQINLAWTDSSATETGFKIERKSGAAGTYSQIATVAANVAAYSDSGLASGANYFYRVRANNTSGDSAYSNEATATLNSSPSVSLTSPAANAIFGAPASIVVTATAADTDGTIAKVEIFDGTTPVGTVTSAPYSVTLSGVSTGPHTYSAKATDNLGAFTNSASVNVTVGVSLTLAFIEVDHLNTPKLVANAAGQTVWRWNQQEPFGSDQPDQNPNGLGVFDLPLRLPGQTYDGETGLEYNYYRDFDPSIGSYKESDPVGLRGGLNTYAYVHGDPLRHTDPLGLMCVSGNGMTTCFTPNGPIFTVPTPVGFPQTLSGGNIGYHIYSVLRSLGCADPDAVMQELIKNPTPGNDPNPATPQGAQNNATVLGQDNLVTSYLTTDLVTGSSLVVNMAGKNDGSAFGPGYVARYVQDGQAVTMGEGLNWKQDPELFGQTAQTIAVQLLWGQQMSQIIAKCRCKQ